MAVCMCATELMRAIIRGLWLALISMVITRDLEQMDDNSIDTMCAKVAEKSTTDCGEKVLYYTLEP